MARSATILLATLSGLEQVRVENVSSEGTGKALSFGISFDTTTVP